MVEDVETALGSHRDRLRVARERHTEYEARLEAIRRDVGEGLAQLDRGEGQPGTQVFERLRAKRKQRKPAKRA